MASCANEDDARWIPGFKNKKLGRLPETARPPKAELEDKVAAAGRAREFAELVSSNLVTPAGQVTLRRAARPGIIPRARAVLLARKRRVRDDDDDDVIHAPVSRARDDDWHAAGRSRRARPRRAPGRGAALN